ncbi:hypothetical protein V8C86DRAFT_2483668 [Haematococcus lacustris]
MSPPAGGAFLMPDGSHLGAHLGQALSTCGSHGPTRSRGKSTKRGKDLMFAHIKRQQANLAGGGQADSAGELAELRMLEALGVRRRRRALNDRILREMTGPLSVTDMQQLFTPVPFGWREPSALEIIAAPGHAALWDSFRNIDMDRQARVLQRWEEHCHVEAAAAKASAASSAPGPGAGAAPSGLATAAQALKRWGCVGRKARLALRKANLHSVVALEALVLAFLDTDDPSGQLLLPGIDAWGELLLRGLADFYGLIAAARLPAANPAATPAAHPHLSTPPGHGVDPAGTEPAPAAAPGGLELSAYLSKAAQAAAGLVGLVQVSQQVQGKESPDGPAGADGGVVVALYHRPTGAGLPAGVAHPCRRHPDITCSDVIAALAHAASGSLNAKELQQYVRHHVHGSDAGSTHDWVLV